MLIILCILMGLVIFKVCKVNSELYKKLDDARLLNIKLQDYCMANFNKRYRRNYAADKRTD